MNTEKIAKVLSRYLNLLALRKKRLGRGNGFSGIRTKEKVINFFNKNGEWPSRLSPYKKDKKLATSFENFVCKSSPSYDPILRRIALATGRKNVFKSKHSVILSKQEIIEFIKTHGRAPTTHKAQEIIPGEANLRRKLDYYTINRNDMTLIGQVYATDKCHRSGIPMRFRPLINSHLDIEKPLIRLVKQQQEEKDNE